MKKLLQTTFTIKKTSVKEIKEFVSENFLLFVFIGLLLLSVFSYFTFTINGLALAYNDARSHLNIGRRVVEGLNPGLAQLGSVWLPLPHLLMVPTVWIDFMWQSGLSGALQSMLSFVLTGVLIFFILKELGVGLVGRAFALAVFVFNLNILYLQSTAMTELLLIFTMTAGSYYFILWNKKGHIVDLLKSAFFIMLSTLVRYDGWFLLVVTSLLLFGQTFYSSLKEEKQTLMKSYQKTEGISGLFGTLAFIGIVGWLVWNLLIFNDPLYFAFGPFSAHAQQELLEEAGDLLTKGNLLLSLRIYLMALFYNSGVYQTLLATAGLILFIFQNTMKWKAKLATLTLLAPLAFNIIALYLGHSVIFIQGISGNTWFNVRYGVMLMPAIAIFSGFLIDHAKYMRALLIGLLAFVVIFAFAGGDSVTIDDAKYGSSQKNVSEVSQYLTNEISGEKELVLISVASHDAIIFSSGMPMARFIHEGTGAYWESATTVPDRWVRWIIMRTNDTNDLTWKFVSKTKGFEKYRLIESYPFADIYELEPKYVKNLTDKKF